MKTENKPLISSRLTINGNVDLLTLEDDDNVVTYKGASALLMSRLVQLLDGSLSIVDLSRILEIDPSTLLAILRPLEDVAFVLPLTERHELASNAFLESYKCHCAFYRKELFAQPFWQLLRNGAASKNVVLGWGIEMYHYISAANEHMAVSVAQCRRNNTCRHWLAQHYAEEYNHDKIFMEGLNGSGFATESILNAPPLPATRGLINFLYEAACIDTIGYVATFGVMQSDLKDVTQSGIEAFYQSLTQYYPFASEIFSSFRNHTLLDLNLDHQTLVIERIINSSGPLSEKDVQNAKNAVRDVAEVFMLFFENILEYYGDDSSPIPRRKLEFRMLP